jgi:hypothetical protein
MTLRRIVGWTSRDSELDVPMRRRQYPDPLSGPSCRFWFLLRIFARGETIFQGRLAKWHRV